MLREDEGEGPAYIQANKTRGGFDVVVEYDSGLAAASVDLWSVIQWVKSVRPDLLALTEPPKAEDHPAGTIRHKQDGAYRVTHPRSPYYSTATMLAEEFWNPDTKEWVKIWD